MRKRYIYTSFRNIVIAITNKSSISISKLFALLQWKRNFEVIERRCHCKALPLGPYTNIFMQAHRLTEGVGRLDFDAGLAPYNQYAYEEWKRLTNYIDIKVIET